MKKNFFMLGLVILLTGCAFTGDKIKDYSDRSVVYTWLDIDEVDGNHMYDGGVKQYKPITDEPYWGLSIDKFEGGFLLYHYGLPNGAYKLDHVRMQSCLGFICGNTYYSYDFGVQGDVGAVIINRPDTYYLGSYKLAEEDTGFFEQSKFNVEKIKDGPSQKQMLEHILKNAPTGHPVLEERITQSLSKVK